MKLIILSILTSLLFIACSPSNNMNRFQATQETFKGCEVIKFPNSENNNWFLARDNDGTILLIKCENLFDPKPTTHQILFYSRKN